MFLSTSQIIGLASVLLVIISAFLFLQYVIPRINATFRSSVRTAVYWSVVVLLIQAAFILFSAAKPTHA